MFDDKNLCFFLEGIFETENSTSGCDARNESSIVAPISGNFIKTT